MQPFNSDLQQFDGPIFQKLKNISAYMTQACVKWVCKSGVGEWKEGEGSWWCFSDAHEQLTNTWQHTFLNKG